MNVKGGMETQLASQAPTAQVLLSFLIFRPRKKGGDSIKKLGNGQGILLFVCAMIAMEGCNLSRQIAVCLAGYWCSP